MLNNPVYISNNKESIVTTIEKHLLIYDMDCALNTYKNIYNEVRRKYINFVSHGILKLLKILC